MIKRKKPQSLTLVRLTDFHSDKLLDSCSLLLCYCITDVADNKEEKSEKKGGTAAKEERSGARSKLKDDNKGESKLATEKSVEVRGKKVDVFV